MDGVLVVDKPEGPTSHDVVARVRRALRARDIGHTGTLDPMATGVLVLVAGSATRLARFMAGHDKTYDARVRLGLSTDTWDRTGAVVGRGDPETPLPDRAAVEAALRAFLGEQDQQPPPFSAKKVGGVRAYDLARKGREVVIEPARVTLSAAQVTSFAPPFVDLSARCSAGFYIRSLAHELGRALRCGGCLEALRRTGSGGFTLADSIRLDEIERAPAMALERLVPPERLLSDLPSVVLTDAGARRALHGNDIGPGDLTGSGGPGATPAVRLFDGEGRLLAIARPTGRPGVLHPAVVLK